MTRRTGGQRAAIFAAVGAAGFGLQLAVLWLLITSLRVPVALATALSVSAALLHNFAWHVRFTWRDRRGEAALPDRFVRFVGVNGLVSLIGTTAVTSLLASVGLPAVAANAIAVVLSGVANFVLADRVVFAAMVALMVYAPAGAADAAEPQPDTLAGWSEYVTRTEARISRDLQHPGGDRMLPDGGPDWRRRALAGELLLIERQTRSGGRPIEVPGGMIHHWAGAVFVPGVSLDALLSELRRPSSRRWLPADVLTMTVAPDSPPRLRVSMRIARKSVVDVTYDTEHLVSYVRHDARHVSSISVSTRISELERPGTARERRLAPADDHGFLWRLNAYWQYEQVDGGVLVTCESLSLSRSAPYLLRIVAAPLIDRVARESLHRTLDSLRQGLSASATIR